MSSRDWESRCKRCGKCCHTKDGIACEHLRYIGAASSCDIYAKRHGHHRDISGRAVECLPMEDYVRIYGMPEGCGYR